MQQLSRSLILPLIHYLRETGSDLARILAEVGLEEECLADPDFRISVEKTDALVCAAVEVTGDPMLPIRAAGHIHAGDWGVFEYLLRTSAGGDETLDKVERFHNLLADGDIALTRNEEDNRLSIFVDTLSNGSPAAAEFSMACWVGFGRMISNANLSPLSVEFVHPAPPDTSEHARFFGCPLHFDRARYGMHWAIGDDEHDDDVAVDRELAEFIVARAQRLLEKSDQDNTLEAVRARILAAFREGNPGVEQIAKQMGMSPRTLRRRLEDEGVSFKELRDQLREERARHLLKDPSFAIGEVAHQLGFADPSAFHRAFKRWTGVTPSEFRDVPADL